MGATARPRPPASEPLVSVILTCYEHERFVVRALDAVMAQTYRPIQLIVTDDASTDDSARVIERWLAGNWPDATFLRHEVNAGLCTTLNEALRVVAGDFVAIGSADDWMEPERVERQVACFRDAPPEVGLVHSGVRLVDEDGRELQVVHAEAASVPQGWVFPQQLTMQGILTPSVMVRRRVYDAVGAFTESDVVEDYDMWLRITRDFHVRHVPDVLVNFRWHSGNTTTRVHGEVFDRYVVDCLQRQLGFSPETDRLIRERLARMGFPPDGKSLP